MTEITRYRPAIGSLVDVRVGDRGTAREWFGPGVVTSVQGDSVDVHWCDEDGNRTGGGSYPGTQDIRPHRADAPPATTAETLKS